MAATSKVYGIILAGGQGSRMGSGHIPKSLQQIANFPLLGYVYDAMKQAGITRHISVISPQYQAVFEEEMADIAPNMKYAHQPKPLGTADAVKHALKKLPKTAEKLVIIFGDTPFLRPATIRNMLKSKADIGILAFRPKETLAYGRVVMGADKIPQKIVEHKHATPEEKKINLCNGGAIFAKRKVLERLLKKVNNKNKSKEYYLPDCIGLAHAEKRKIGLIMGQEEEMLGVDSPQMLAQAELIMQKQLRKKAWRKGVVMVEPNHVSFAYDTKFRGSAQIEPFVIFGRGVSIGEGVRVRSFSYIEGSRLEAGAEIGPHARLRGESVIRKGARIGNFVEVKNARIGAGVKAGHL
ncbi:MAG: NTP transferase domain-containing protein, partial [Parvibaculales bacterium]